MILAVHGSKNFNDYAIFLKSMNKAMSNIKKGDDQIFLYAAGPWRVNSMGKDFVNGLKARGVKIQIRKVSPLWIQENFHFLDHFAYFSTKKESLPKIVNSANAKDVPIEVYRY